MFIKGRFFSRGDCIIPSKPSEWLSCHTSLSVLTKCVWRNVIRKLLARTFTWNKLNYSDNLITFSVVVGKNRELMSSWSSLGVFVYPKHLSCFSHGIALRALPQPLWPCTATTRLFFLLPGRSPLSFYYHLHCLSSLALHVHFCAILCGYSMVYLV